MEIVKLNYTPGSMSFADGFMGPKGDVGYIMVASQQKAHEIIKEQLGNGRAISHAEMGLDGDWGVNSNTIYEGGKYFDYESYSESQWATPIVIIFYTDGPSETYPVWTKDKL